MKTKIIAYFVLLFILLASITGFAEPLAENIDLNEDFVVATPSIPTLSKAPAALSPTGTIYWGVSNSGVLKISTVAQTSSQYKGSFYSKDSYFSTSNPAPWWGLKNKITTVIVGNEASGDIVVPKFFNTWFFNMDRITSITFDGINTSLITAGMFDMFYGCSSLTYLDLRKLDTGSTNSMMRMFANCTNLKSVDLSNFETGTVGNMLSMFENCSSLESLDLTSFDTSGVSVMNGMFKGCSSLTDLEFGFDTSSVLNMSQMFYGCPFDSITLNGFDTSKVQNMSEMFKDCTDLFSLDISSFDTSSVTNMDGMFDGCDSLFLLSKGNSTVLLAGTLPAPDGSKMPGADGNWYGFSDGTPYIPSEVESGQAGTYCAIYGFVEYNYLIEPEKRVEEYIPYNGNYNIRENEVSLTGYSFSGWNTEPNGTGTNYLQKQLIGTSADKQPLRYSTLYGQWKKNKYQVVFDKNGHGNDISGVSVYYNEKISEPNKPSASGYTFKGWFKEVSLINEWNFDSDLMPANDIVLYAKWQYTGGSGGGGSSSGGGGSSSSGGGGGGGAAGPKATSTTATFSKFWTADVNGAWRILNKGQVVTSAWLCDDAIDANGQNVWYLMNTDGTMLAAGLVQDNTGNFYSLETTHNGYYGMLRYKNGTYDCNGQQIYLEFSNKHDGTFGAVTNAEGLAALKAIYGVTKFGIGNERCMYTKTFE